jgi:cytochrome c5
MSGKTGFILTASVAIALLLLGGSTAAQSENPGEKILMQRCQGCHDLRPVHTSALDAAGWTKTIETMIKENGAEVAKDEMPVLVKYLTQNFGPVPDGPGKEILLNTCTMCHDLGRIKTARRSAGEWEETLNSMLNEGAPLSDEQFPVIHRYLSRYFGVPE